MRPESTARLNSSLKRLSTLSLLLLCACSTVRPPPACLEPPPPDPALMQPPTYQHQVLSILCQGPTSADPSCQSVTSPTPK